MDLGKSANSCATDSCCADDPVFCGASLAAPVTAGATKAHDEELQCTQVPPGQDPAENCSRVVRADLAPISVLSKLLFNSENSP